MIEFTTEVKEYMADFMQEIKQKINEDLKGIFLGWKIETISTSTVVEDGATVGFVALVVYSKL